MEECAFIIKKKNRTCKMKPQNNSIYCPQHFHLDTNQTHWGDRIPCPLDPKHSCYKSKLKSHLKKCNSRAKTPPPYFKERINADENRADTFTLPKRSKLCDMADEEVKRIISKVELTFKELNADPPKEYFSTEDEMLVTGLKHIDQQEALVTLMKKINLLCDGTAFIEFGAGRGQMTCHIAKNLNSPESCQFVLIDRQACRYKQDTKLKHELGSKIQRIRIDIEHLNVSKLPLDSFPIIGISKHLCGAATDLSLRSLLETLDDVKKLKGIVFALCCHHRCDWRSYVGKKSFENWGYTAQEFSTVCALSSWATCGGILENKHVAEGVEEQTEKVLSRYERLELSAEYREQIGYQCKQLLNEGRRSYVKEKGLACDLHKYVDSKLSLENIVLVAV